MNLIRSMRRLRGWSQAELARRVDRDQALLSKLENEQLRDTPAIVDLKKRTAAALGVPFELLFRSDAGERP